MAKPPIATSDFRRESLPLRRITSVSLPPLPDAERIIAEAKQADGVGQVTLHKAALPAALAAEMFTTFSPHDLTDEDVAATLVRLGAPSHGFMATGYSIESANDFDAIEVASSLSAHGRANEAEALLRQALVTEAGRNGRDTELHFRLELALGRLLGANDAILDAKRMLVATVERVRSTLGTRHPLTLDALETLGLLLVEQHELVYAEPLLCEVVLVRRNMMGDQDPNTLRALSALSTLLIAQGKANEAEPLLRRALTAQTDNLGKAHPQTLMTRNSLAVVLAQAGNVADAEALLTFSARAARSVHGEASLPSLMQAALLAQFLLDNARPAEARHLLVDAYDVAARLLNPSHSVRNRLRGLLGQSLRLLGNWHKAEGHLVAAYESLRETLGLNHLATQAMLGELIALYTAWGKPAAAAPFRAVHAQCS